MTDWLSCPKSLHRWRRRMQKDKVWHEAEGSFGRLGTEDWTLAEGQDVDDCINQTSASRVQWSWAGLSRELEDDEDEDEWTWAESRSRKPKWMFGRKVNKSKKTRRLK